MENTNQNQPTTPDNTAAVFPESQSKMKLISLILGALVVVGVGAYAIIVPAMQVPTVIKIGWPSPLTGAIASFGEVDPWMVKRVTKIINEDRGGIYLSKYGKKIPIEILLRDTKSDEQTTASVTEDLITTDKVDMIVALGTPTTGIPAATMCEKYHVPCFIGDTPVLSWLSGAPYDWSYLHFWAEPDLTEVYAGMWDQIKTNKKVGGLWNDDPDGRSFQKATRVSAQAHGYDLVADEGLSPYGLTEYTPYIKDWMQKKVEIVTGEFIPPDFAVLRRQMDELGYHPKVLSVAKAILFPPSVEELGGDLPLGLTTEVWASKYSPGVSSLSGLTNTGLADLWEKESGRQWTQPLFYSEGAFEIVADVLTRAGTVDKTAIKNALADTDLDTTVGHVSFKAPLSPDALQRYATWPELFANKSHYSLAPIVGGQWVKGVGRPWDIQIVYNGLFPQIPVTSTMIEMPGK
jgi:branched-chain amino acid transport system substrate-binding protein